MPEIHSNNTHWDTAEFATQLHRSPQTIRRLVSEKGEAYGVRPIKIGNKLLWPIADVKALLEGGAK